jgi:glycosyltransferase involved in cell wall biosynthesis
MGGKPTKIAIVVQRYGLEVSGGAEYYARLIAEHLNKYLPVEVITTCALDYISWENHYPGGEEAVNGIPVHRFPVRKKRNPYRFGRIQDFVFNNPYTRKDELRFLKEEGPYSPALIRYLKKTREKYRFFIFISYRYYQSYHGVNLIPERSLLVPTAENDPVINLEIFKPFFHLPRAIIYCSHEERAMINRVSGNEDIAGDVVGVGLEVPDEISPDAFRRKYSIKKRFILYLGRIDENKGCPELFRFFTSYLTDTNDDILLVLIGKDVLDIPEHPNIVHLGFLSEEDKFNALAASELLVMPSYYESLSIVLLEAFAVTKPALVNSACDVLKGQAQRSNGALYYQNYYQFAEALNLLTSDSRLREKMGENGRKYLEENYHWEVIEGKYLKIINQLLIEDGERPLPIKKGS